jgi:hypothetical protein
LIKASGIEVSANKLIHKEMHNFVDTQPRVNTAFMPGDAYLRDQKQDSDTSLDEEDV